MRFDDKLDTAFAQPADSDPALAAAWMQIVDILAQGAAASDAEQRAAAFTRLHHWREKVSPEKRQSSSRSLSGRNVAADLIAFFAADTARVAAPLLATAQLTDEAWQSIIPEFPSTSRSLLRERRDLSGPVQAMLASFGASDFALPPGDMEVLPSEEADTPIRIKDLVDRINAFRQAQDTAPVASSIEKPAPESFQFETGADGQINWVNGAPRGALIGIELATMAEIGAHGVDGHAAGAFRRRTPFRNARMLVPGDGVMSGAWLISGLPCFNDRDGRFFGYRCTARRALRNEHLVAAPTTLLGGSLPPDSIRQLVHELRTPLNAIRGFAEMIQGQLLGPVSSQYRGRAEQIIAESATLLRLFEDLDTAAKLDRDSYEIRANQPSDMAQILRSVLQEFLTLTNVRQVQLRFASQAEAARVAVDAATVERMVSRLVGAVLGLASEGEVINGSMRADNRQAIFRLERPLCLAGQNERDLLDPSFVLATEFEAEPSLGLGFALRLISSTARAANGRFVITSDAFELRLPSAGDVTSDPQTNQS